MYHAGIFNFTYTHSKLKNTFSRASGVCMYVCDRGCVYKLLVPV